MLNNQQKVVIIGIDGGTFDIIDSLIKNGRAPNFKALQDSATRGKLRSTFPPMTYPAWNTFMTGVNPGIHGVFDFTEHVEGKYSIVFTNSRSRKVKTIWTLLSDMGKRVAVMGVPLTYPPEPVNGMMVSGFDTPVGGDADNSICHPKELFSEIDRVAGGYQVSANIANPVESDNMETAFARIKETLRKKIRTALHFLNKEPWDCFMVLFGESDLISHHFWRYHDSNSPFHPPNASDICKDAVNQIYEDIDGAIGQIIKNMDENTTLLIMSDHGFGGNSRRAFFLNNWLQQNNLLTFKPQSPLKKIMVTAKNIGLTYLPHRLKVQLLRKIKGIANTTESVIRFSGIDWEKTQIYSEETPYYPGLWLNLKGREPSGIINKPDYEKKVRQVILALKDWHDPETGQPVFRNVYRRNEIYSGDQVFRAPDIILEPNSINGYSYLSRPSRTRPSSITLDTISQSEISASQFQNKSGSHRNHGIFYGLGKPFSPGKILDGCGLIDLAPTIFSLMGLPIPKVWEGDSLISKETQKAENLDIENLDISNPAQKEEYSQEEAAILENRLRSMGYME